MKAYSNYYIKDSDVKGKVMIVSDQDPTGVTFLVKDLSDDGRQESITLPRQKAIEALEYLVAKIKA